MKHIHLRSAYTYLFFLFILFSPLITSAQDGDTPPPPQTTEDAVPLAKQYYVFSPRVSVTVPHPMANKSFKKCFVGIYEVSAGLNMYLYKGLFIGVTGKDGLLKITENKISDYNASLYINNAAGKLGADVYIGDKNRVIYSVALSVGKNWANYTGLVAKDANKTKLIPNTYSCNYFEPEMNLFFLVESNFGIGATVSYSIFDHIFDPYALSLNDWTQFSKTNIGSTQYLSFGFGFYYSFLRKKAKRPGL